MKSINSNVALFETVKAATGTQLEPRTLTEKLAARYIGMSVSWLRQARNFGNPEAPPHLKIGKSVRYLKEDLDSWLVERRRH